MMLPGLLLYIFKPCESIIQIGICRAVVRGTPCGRTLFVRKKIQQLTYIEPCRGGYYPPAVLAVACGYSRCRGRRVDDPLALKIYIFARVM